MVIGLLNKKLLKLEGPSAVKSIGRQGACEITEEFPSCYLV